MLRRRTSPHPWKDTDEAMDESFGTDVREDDQPVGDHAGPPSDDRPEDRTATGQAAQGAPA